VHLYKAGQYRQVIDRAHKLCSRVKFMQIGDIIDKLEMFVALPRMASMVAGFNIDGPF